VKDETGKTIGLVTLEDIVESIIGDLSDEYDILPDFCYQIAENRYVVGGGATLAFLSKQVDASFPDQPLSVNDWIIRNYKPVPKPEDAVQLKHLMLLIRKVSRAIFMSWSSKKTSPDSPIGSRNMGGHPMKTSTRFRERFRARSAVLFAVICMIQPAAHGQKHENLALTPPMGWNSWNRFAGNINEILIRQIADAMVSSGMRDAGYRYVNIDDCWHGKRDSLGFIHPDPDRFPSGMKSARRLRPL